MPRKNKVYITHKNGVMEKPKDEIKKRASNKKTNINPTKRQYIVNKKTTFKTK